MISTSMNNVPLHEFLSAAITLHCLPHLHYHSKIYKIQDIHNMMFMYLFYVQQQYKEVVMQDKSYPISGPNSVELSSDGRTVSSNEHYECISRGKGEGEVHSPQKS